MKYTKAIIYMVCLAGLLTAVGCKESYTLYDNAEYIMFADTAAFYPVQKDVEYFEVPVVSTVKCDYDRTVAVEIIDRNSTAIEDRHFSLKSNTLTIKAGENRANVQVCGNYDRIEAEDNLSFQLRLVMPEQLVTPMYGDTTRVRLMKICPFNIDDFTGCCMTTSMFLYSFNPNKEYQRVIYTEKHPTLENAIICHDWLYDGYDVTIRLDNSDVMEPKVLMEEGQVISDEGSVFGTIRGDDRIQAAASPLYPSYFYPCGKYLFLWTEMYVEKFGETVGTVGHFYNVMEWVSDAEAERIHREMGIPAPALGYLPEE